MPLHICIAKHIEFWMNEMLVDWCGEHQHTSHMLHCSHSTDAHPLRIMRSQLMTSHTLTIGIYIYFFLVPNDFSLGRSNASNQTIHTEAENDILQRIRTISNWISVSHSYCTQPHRTLQTTHAINLSTVIFCIYNRCKRIIRYIFSWCRSKWWIVWSPKPHVHCTRSDSSKQCVGAENTTDQSREAEKYKSSDCIIAAVAVRGLRLWLI